MKAKSIDYAVLASLVWLLFIVGRVVAQGDSCPAIVTHGAPGGTPGKNEGDCTLEACATFEYALEQGQNLCSQEVHVFYVDENREFEELEWRMPSTENQTEDRWLAILSRIGPAPGLLAGWLLGLILAYVLFKPASRR